MIVLVAENEALLAVTLALQLEAAGHRVLGPAATLEDAAALALDERPDLALVDIDLDHRGDGVTLARELQERWHVPSLFVTGRPEVARAAADAALGVISKPYDLADIDESVLVAESIISGGAPRLTPLPPSLELFARSAPAAVAVPLS
jgi:DNA-binding response OmpR family regulator